MKKLLFLLLILNLIYCGQDKAKDEISLSVDSIIVFDNIEFHAGEFTLSNFYAFAFYPPGNDIIVEVNSEMIDEMTDSEFTDFAMLVIICMRNSYVDSIGVLIFNKEFKIPYGDYMENLCRKFLPERAFVKEKK